MVYVRPGSIYLVIGAKTSSVRNIVVYGTWLFYITRKFSIRQTSCSSTVESCRDSSSSTIIIHTADSHCSHQSEGEGPCDSFALHCTQLRESCTFRLWRLIKKLCIPQRLKIWVVLKPWLFQTVVYLETGYRPMPSTHIKYCLCTLVYE